VRGRAAKTLLLESAILSIVNERAPLTVRGVGYALFVRSLIPSMELSHTHRVSRIMTAMREEGTLDWTKIVDGSRPVDRVSTWTDPNEIIKAAVRGYRRDYWQDQPVVVEVWSEKSTVQGILQPVLDEFGITFRLMRGFSSFTVVKQAAVDSMDIAAFGKRLFVLYIGDWDPSGLWMSEKDLPDRLVRYGGDVELLRIALLQSDTTDLPSFAVKQGNPRTGEKGDPRAKWFVQNYGRRCWELDAMDPNALRARVEMHIEAHIDRDLWARALKIEKAEIASMQDFQKAWQSGLAGDARTGRPLKRC
jgi:hypothetical protein